MLVVFAYDVCLYDIPDAPSSLDPIRSPPAWSYQLDSSPILDTRTLSHSFEAEDSTCRLLLFNGMTLYRLTIPSGDLQVQVDTTPTDPKITNTHLRVCLGQSHGLWWHNYSTDAGFLTWMTAEESMALQAFTGLKAVGSNLVERKLDTSVRSGAMPWVFDEKSGRVFVPSGKNETGGYDILIMDFV